jgi:hypothetical protein
VKTAPHFGHLIFASFCTPAHPKEKTAKIANAKKILTHFLITLHLLSSTDTMLKFKKMVLTTNGIEKTDNKIPLHCQEKNNVLYLKTFSKTTSSLMWVFSSSSWSWDVSFRMT